MKNFLDKATDHRMSTNSFKFYVPAPFGQENLGDNGDESFEKSGPSLHQGEIIITEGQRVLLFPHVAEKSKGLAGNLYVTNFRLIFMAYEEDGTHEDEVLHQKNLLFGKHSVCLTNIDSIHQLSKDKKRKLYPDTALNGKVKGLQILCKNMRVLTFSFDQSPIDQGKIVTKTLLHHAFPGRHQLLFAYDYRDGKSLTEKPEDDVIMFNNRHEWEDELTRTCSKSASKWRLSSQNQTFQLSPSLPRWLIIPQSVLDYDLTTASGSFRCNRPPIWTWSSPNGAALVRMADLLPTITDRTQENRMLENIRKCHPQLKGPEIKDLDKDLPSIKDLLNSFLKLRDLCTPEDRRQFKIQDAHLYSALDNTKWLHHVSACLKVSVEAAQEIQRGTTVVLQESDGRDTSAIVSSLVQLILDPHTRSKAGFQSLIQKEWVALGHPFCTRLGHVRTNDSEQSPVFLLFLDCVWQLQYQFPSAFEITETYLTTLWDSAHVSVFDTFLFDCEKDRIHAFTNSSDPLTPISIWNWSKQFSSSDIQLFFNPLYKFSEFQNVVNQELNRSQTKHASHESDSVLRPKYQIPFMEIWTQCYFRWLPLLSIKSGGLPQIDVCQRQLMKDVKSLLCVVKEFSKKSVENGVYNNNVNKCTKLSRLKLTEIHEGESSDKVDIVSALFEKRDVIDNFFPFSFDSTSGNTTALTNSSNLSEFDSQSVLNLTE